MLTILVEAHAPHEFHREEWLPFAGFATLVDRGDAWMLKPRENLHFTPEQAHAVGIGSGDGADDFQRDVAAGLILLGEVDGAHAAFADFLEDAVARRREAEGLFLRARRCTQRPLRCAENDRLLAPGISFWQRKSISKEMRGDSPELVNSDGS